MRIVNCLRGSPLSAFALFLCCGCHEISFSNTTDISKLEVCLVSEGSASPPCWVPATRWSYQNGMKSSIGAMHAISPSSFGEYKFWLHDYPPGLHLYAEGVDADNCVIRVADEPKVPTGQGLTVAMTTVSSRECRLRVDVSGPGRVAAVADSRFSPGSYPRAPKGCQHEYLDRYPEGTEIILTPEPGPNAHFVGWEGGCESKVCRVTVRAGMPVIKARFAAGLCTSPSFCWENPLPQGNPLRGVWFNQTGSWFAVGDSGTLLRRDADGSGLVADQVTSRDLNAVASADTGTVWAAGAEGEVWAYSLAARSWQQVSYEWVGTRPRWRTLSAAQGPMVHAGGDAPDLLRFDGSAWVERSSNSTVTAYHRIWGPSPDVQFAAGDNSTLLSLQGGLWTPTYSVCSPGNRFRGLWGLDRSRLWLATEGGALYRYEPMMQRCTREDIAAGAGAIYAIGGEPVSGEMWAVGAGGLLLARDPSGTWSDVPAAAKPQDLATGAFALNDVWGVPGKGLYAVGDAGIMMERSTAGAGGGWRLDQGDAATVGSKQGIGDGCTADAAKPAPPAAATLPPRISIQKIYGVDLSDIWAVAEDGSVLHWNGGQWLVDWTPVAADAITLKDIWADASEVWAVGADRNDRGIILRRREGIWTRLDAPTVDATSVRINAIAGNGSRLFLVGAQGLSATMKRGDGTGWTACPLDTLRKDLLSVALVENQVIIGSTKLIDGDTDINIQSADCTGARTVELTGSNAAIMGIYASSMNDIWAAGDQAVLQKTGAKWVVTDTPGERYSDVHGAGDLVWFVGKGGLVRVYDRTKQTFQMLNAGTRLALNGVWIASRDAGWLVGQSGAILRYIP